MTDAELPGAHDGELAGKSQEELRFAMERAWAEINLSHLVGFYKAVRALLKEKLQSPDIAKDPALKSTLGLYDVMNAGNTLLVALAWFEEMLYHVWKDRHPGKRPPKKGSMTERYKPLLKDLGVDLAGGTSWSVLKDAEKIRHCLLHANGRISLMRNPSLS